MAVQVRALTEADVIPHSAATTLPTSSTLTRRAVVQMYTPPSTGEPSPATSGEIQDPFRTAARRLEALAWLPKEWDGSHSPEISGKAIAVGRGLLDIVKRWQIGAPNVAPTVVGGLQLEWRGPGGWEFSIDIDAAGAEMLSFANPVSGELWEGGVDLVPDSISDVFWSLIAAAKA